MSGNLAEINVHEAELVQEVARYVDRPPLDQFHRTRSGRMYSEPLRFKEDAPPELVAAWGGQNGGMHVSNNMNHIRFIYIAQILATDYDVPVGLRSIGTVIKAHRADIKTGVVKDAWEYSRELVLDSVRKRHVILCPRVVVDSGRIVYDQIQPTAKKVHKRGNIFDVLTEAGVLRKHNVKLLDEGLCLDEDSNNPGAGSVGSYPAHYDYENVRYVFAGGPSDMYGTGLARLEVVKGEDSSA